MGGLAKKPKKPKQQPAPLAPDPLEISKAKRRAQARSLSSPSTIMSDALGG